MFLVRLKYRGTKDAQLKQMAKPALYLSKYLNTSEGTRTCRKNSYIAKSLIREELNKERLLLSSESELTCLLSYYEELTHAESLVFA